MGELIDSVTTQADGVALLHLCAVAHAVEAECGSTAVDAGFCNASVDSPVWVTLFTSKPRRLLTVRLQFHPSYAGTGAGWREAVRVGLANPNLKQVDTPNPLYPDKSVTLVYLHDCTIDAETARTIATTQGEFLPHRRYDRLVHVS